ncbi:MAG: hypothetical protein AB7I01_16545 [Gammaproteobacteria bacterium]
MTEFLYGLDSRAVAAALALTLLCALDVGYRFGRPRAATSSEALRSHIGVVEGSLLGLLALVLGFTFAVALQHFDARYQAVVTEANALGTTWLRSALLPEPARGELRALVLQYVDARIAESHVTLAADDARKAALVRTDELVEALWAATARALAADDRVTTTGFFVQTLNDAIDAYGARNAALDHHVPEVVLWILFATFAVSAGVLGYGAGLAAHRPPLASVLLVLLMVVVSYLIVDLDRPRRGLVQVSQQPMLNLRASMAPNAPIAP